MSGRGPRGRSCTAVHVSVLGCVLAVEDGSWCIVRAVIRHVRGRGLVRGQSVAVDVDAL
jgi:hypothetical protein